MLQIQLWGGGIVKDSVTDTVMVRVIVKDSVTDTVMVRVRQICY